MVLVNINGNKERIDNFCGTNLPAQVMSNGPVLTVEFVSMRRDGHGLYGSSPHYSNGLSMPSGANSLVSNYGVNQNFRGFRATYQFLTGINLILFSLSLFFLPLFSYFYCLLTQKKSFVCLYFPEREKKRIFASISF